MGAKLTELKETGCCGSGVMSAFLRKHSRALESMHIDGRFRKQIFKFYRACHVNPLLNARSFAMFLLDWLSSLARLSAVRSQLCCCVTSFVILQTRLTLEAPMQLHRGRCVGSLLFTLSCACLSLA